MVPNGALKIEVGRLSIFNDLLQVFRKYPSITTRELCVSFRNEGGIDGGGLSRELFAAFWESAELEVFEGCIEKIPSATP